MLKTIIMIFLFIFIVMHLNLVVTISVTKLRMKTVHSRVWCMKFHRACNNRQLHLANTTKTLNTMTGNYTVSVLKTTR